ncbi:MAG: Phage virion morphosis family [Solirubrobacterales bacterium]|nr:Phage virion morphosis family [Solirubrobacterales bacterium]
MKFTLDVLNADRARRNIEAVGERATNAKPVLEEAAKVLANGITVNFATHGAHFGEPWPAKADGTPATLVEFGGLAAAVGNLQRATNTMAVAGIRGPEAYIARFHQGGTEDRGRGGKLPRRRIVGVSVYERVRVLNMVEQYLVSEGG